MFNFFSHNFVAVSTNSLRSINFKIYLWLYLFIIKFLYFYFPTECMSSGCGAVCWPALGRLTQLISVSHLISQMALVVRASPRPLRHSETLIQIKSRPLPYTLCTFNFSFNIVVFDAVRV